MTMTPPLNSYTSRIRGMDPPVPLQPGQRTLSFQGGETTINWRRIVLPSPLSGSVGGDKSGLTGKGKERAYPGSNTSSGSSHLHITHTDLGRKLDEFVKSTYHSGVQPDIVGVFQASEDAQSYGLYWFFSMTARRTQEVDLLIPLDCSTTKGSFDLSTLTTCMHGSSPHCTLCASNGGGCVRQPGRGTRSSEVFASATPLPEGQGAGSTQRDGERFGQVWAAWADALVDFYAWMEGWMFERLAGLRRRRVLRRQGGSEEPGGPTMRLRGREHSTGLDLDLLITARECEDLSVSASYSASRLERTPWDMVEGSQAGKEYRLWPSDETGRYIKRVELDDIERDTVIETIGDQVGMTTGERLKGEEEWAFLWIREDPIQREGAGAQGQKGWYCVWPSGWLVEPGDGEKGPPRKESAVGKRCLDKKVDNPATRPMKPADSAARLLAALRSDTPTQLPQDPKEMDFEMLTDLAPPADGLPSLFDTQSWLDYDPVLDMASEMADTPADLGLGAPTPLGRTETDQAAPVNHDSVDAISSKILSPTANPTPAAQRDWDMMVTAYEMAQNEDVITETDFNFFDAPHRSMFDAFDDAKDEMHYDLDDQRDKGDLVQPDGGKGSWVETADHTLPVPDPAPPYTAKATSDAPVDPDDTIELAFREVPMELAREDGELEDDSDDLFGEKEDESDERSSEQELQVEQMQPEPALKTVAVLDGVLTMPSDFGPARSERVQEQAADSVGSQSSAIDVMCPAPKLIDLIDVRYTVDNVRGAFLPSKHSSLKWTSRRQSNTLMRSTKRAATLLVKTHGDGLVKDRRGHRARLRKTLARRRWSSAYDAEDFATDSDSGVELSDQDSDDGWMLYEVDANQAQKNQTATGPAKAMQKFDLNAHAWTCPNIIGLSRYTRSASVTPMTDHSSAILSAGTDTVVPSIDIASALRRGFRDWLGSLIIEDPTLRECLFGRSLSPDRLPRSRESLDIRVRVGHCGRSADMDGNAVRFWRQLGLTPFSGQKDISVFVLFDSAYTDMHEAVGLQSELDQAYQARGFGQSVKMNELLSFDTVLDVRASGIQAAFDDIRQRQLQHIPTIIVVLLQDELTTDIHVLQDLYDRYAAIYPANTSTKTILQPAFLNHWSYSSSADRLASCIYHRIQTTYAPRHPTVSTPPTVSLYAPAFTLCATTTTPAASFAVQWPAPTTNPHDTGRMIHVTYTMTSSNALIAVCMDEYGEWWAFDCVQVGSGPHALARALANLWQVVKTYAANATIEWRFIIARLGHCRDEELRYWLATCETALASRPAQFALVQCVQDSLPSAVGRHESSEWMKDSVQVIIPAGQTSPIAFSGSFACGQNSSGNDSQRLHQVQHLLSSTSAQSTISQTDGELLADIRSSYEKLTRLGNLRWALSSDSNLPPHIEALNVYRELNIA